MNLWKITVVLNDDQEIGDCFWYTDLRTGEKTITQEQEVTAIAQSYNTPVFKKEEIKERKITQLV